LASRPVTQEVESVVELFRRSDASLSHSRQRREMVLVYSGAFLALLSAVLFGISPVLIKLFSSEMPPVLTAGLLYLGSGSGLLFPRLIRNEPIFKSIRIIPLTQKFQLAGAILCGGIIAPIFLTYGIFHSSAFQVSALLNLETVATTIIAAIIFHEHVSARVWFGKIFVIAGALLLSLTGKMDMVFSPFSFFIVGACIFWGIDNNLTRNIEDLPPSVLAGIKGISAGLFNVLLAFLLHQTSSDTKGLASTFITGTLSYGLSLVLFVCALRKIGASRTSTYFAAGPFIGMLGSVIFLGERPPLVHWFAGIVMLLGIYTLYRERHEHEHTHEPNAHSHLHIHDEHHQHEHDGTEGPEPHDHFHKHERLIHSHHHLPDTHHRHEHKKHRGVEK